MFLQLGNKIEIYITYVRLDNLGELRSVVICNGSYRISGEFSNC